MKKVNIALGTLAALILILGAFYFWNRSLQDNTDGSPVANDSQENGENTGLATAMPTTDDGVNNPVDEPEEGEPTVVAELPGDLPALPRLEGSSAATGLGGGGDLSTGAALPIEETAMDADSMFMPFMNVFSGTTFLLNSDLPQLPAVAIVQQQPDLGVIDLATAQDIARRFGFTGQLYAEIFPVYDQDIAIEGDVSYSPPVVYHAFDGDRRLFIDSWGAYYNDTSVEYDYQNPLPYDAALPIAEAFFGNLGLLDFPYVTQQGYSGEVFFLRQVDGYPVNQPELVVTVNGDGTVIFASYQGLRQANNLGRYPLISAATAWEKLQTGVLDNSIPYSFLPNFAIEPAVYEDPYADLYQYWTRTYEPGAEIHLYEWPIVFQPAEGVGAPRIEIYNYVLDGDLALLNEIATNNGTQIHLWGQPSADGETLIVAGWEPYTNNEPVSEEGVISLVGDEVRFTGTFSGQTFVLPDAPADITDALEVYVFGWNVRDTGGEFPELDWNSIEKIIDYEAIAVEGEASPDIAIDEPFPSFTGYSEVNIDAVEIEYYYTYIWPEVDENVEYDGRAFQNPTILLQPTWKFSGTTDNGERLAFYVQAVDETFLQGE
jgi:hypothetical protein